MSARPWFRFHLSTLVVLVLAAGVLLGLNMVRHPVPQMNGSAYGFPLPMYQNWMPSEELPGATGIRFIHDSYIRIGSAEFQYSKNGWSYSIAAINFAAALLILAVIAFCMEKFVRSRNRN